jgi:negative regulator of sigma E activity
MWKLEKSKTNCERYEAMLADAADQAVDRGEKLVLSADLAAHVSGCEHCREAADAVAVSRSLLRSGLEPAAAPGPYFAPRVMAAIRAEESRLTTERLVFWRPLEHLAARMAVVAATVVLLLSFYVYAVAPRMSSEDTAQAQNYELVPHQQVDPQPQTKDEVLMSLAEVNNNGR